jgi:hypothetical protein
VLVVYSAAARAAAGGTAQIEAEIALGIAETNAYYAQSGIAQRVRLVHTAEVAFGNGVGYEAALNQLTNTADGVLDNVHALRNAYGADLVSLWVESFAEAGICGVAWLLQTVSASFATSGFSVLARPGCAVSNKSFAHELGHNMGARHDHYVESGSLTPFYNYGYVHLSATPSERWRTVMAYNNQCLDSGYSCTRLGYFSNPDKSYGTPP